MKFAKTLLATATLTLMTTAALASDARTYGMGGAGVANGKYHQAASLNPALIAGYEERDNFGLILPAIGAEVADQTEVFDAVDAFQDSYDRLERLLQQFEQGLIDDEAAIEQARAELADRFGDIRGELLASVHGQVALAIPNRFAAMQFFATGELQAFGTARLDERDLDVIINAQSTDALDELISEGFVVGRLVADFGVAIARTFNIAGREVRLGFSPKIQEIESFTYFSSIRDIDEDNFDASEFRSSSSQFNVDFGASLPITQRLSAGLSVRNLIPHETAGAPIFSRRLDDIVTLDYETNREVVAGLGYNTRRMSLSVDVDVLAQNYLGLSDDSQRTVFGERVETQFVRAGYEYDLGRWAQLRLGYRHDLQGTYDDAYTAGVGLSPFGRVHLNLSASYTDDRSFGGTAQLMFTF